MAMIYLSEHPCVHLSKIGYLTVYLSLSLSLPGLAPCRLTETPSVLICECIYLSKYLRIWILLFSVSRALCAFIYACVCMHAAR